MDRRVTLMSVIAFTTIMKWEEVLLSEVQNQQEYMLRIWVTGA